MSTTLKRRLDSLERTHARWGGSLFVIVQPGESHAAATARAAAGFGRPAETFSLVWVMDCVNVCPAEPAAFERRGWPGLTTGAGQPDTR